MNMKHFLLFFTVFCIKFVICRDFYVGMFKKDDILVASDRLFKAKVPFRQQFAKYGRKFPCKITYMRVIDRLGYGKGPKVMIIRGGLQKKFVVLRLSAYNSPISANIYIGCANKMKKTTTKTTITTTITTTTAASTRSGPVNDTSPASEVDSNSKMSPEVKDININHESTNVSPNHSDSNNINTTPKESLDPDGNGDDNAPNTSNYPGGDEIDTIKPTASDNPGGNGEEPDR